MLLVPADVLAHVRQHAAAEFPRECCGILLGSPPGNPAGDSTIHCALPARNLADPDRRHDRYIVDPLAILEADRAAHARHLEILGFYHSHPNHPAQPSATDITLAWPCYVYLVISITSEQAFDLRAWQFNAAGNAMDEIPIQSPPLPSPLRA